MIKRTINKYNLKLLSILCISLALLTACTGTSDSSGGGAGDFKFIVFGDFNGGGCDRMSRVSNMVNSMNKEQGIAFFVSTGDLIDGFIQGDGSTSCFASDPAGTTVCSPKGNISQVLSPLKNRTPVSGLEASFYPVIGNHDDNWGSTWYPDPCGDGICDFLSPLTPETYIKHSHGDICSKDQNTSAHSTDFYYSFTYQNSYFIILRINDDSNNMLGSCSNLGATSYPNCETYCSDPTLLDDATRNNDCWGDQGQFKWFLSELEKSQTYDNVFVFSHAVSLAGGDGHPPYAGADKVRAVAEAAGVDIYFNGHNHAYHRTGKVKGTSLDNTGTTYITTGVAGAAINYTSNDWYTAKTVNDWADAGRGQIEAQNAAYIIVTINSNSITGDVIAPHVQAAPVDTFTL